MISMQKHKMGCGIDDLRPPEVTHKSLIKKLKLCNLYFVLWFHSYNTRYKGVSLSWCYSSSCLPCHVGVNFLKYDG